MNEPEVAPYGGFIVKSLDDEKENQAKIEELSIEVEHNGTIQKLRPEAFRLNGVDNLSTEEIKSYVDYYLNYTVSKDPETGKLIYNQIPLEDEINFRVEWIDDSNVVIVFKTNQDNLKAIRQVRNIALTTDENDPDIIDEIIQEVDAKDYNPIIEFRKSQSLSNRLGLPEKESETIDEDETFTELKIRQAFQSDRKIKNASQFSRYYLLHGEPEREVRPRRKNFNRNRHEREPTMNHNDQDNEDLFSKKAYFKRHNENETPTTIEQEDEEEDLFADKLKGRNGRRIEISSTRNQDDEDLFAKKRGVEEDLFAHKLKKTRSRSPTRNPSHSRYKQRY
ncbi:hypothetical protein KGF54_000876 [Candida jiufengensis]|uniref:uncharacterized protein n=1 Tax=Candida jiufengensis TaxID=497108 RepID=UPI002224FB87|nr:uncharacterized protein KGF54_000876 [Candida jiufengensis]KAI5956401.1 hypothetical protein KGF54_000876 [Candida jiufengensis]